MDKTQGEEDKLLKGFRNGRMLSPRLESRSIAAPVVHSVSFTIHFTEFFRRESFIKVRCAVGPAPRLGVPVKVDSEDARNADAGCRNGTPTPPDTG